MKHYWSASKPINVNAEAFADVPGLRMEPSVSRKHNIELLRREGKTLVIGEHFLFYRLNTLLKGDYIIYILHIYILTEPHKIIILH